jgi:hypothetical protein
MRWFFFTCFVAAVISSVLWTALIVFAFVTRGVLGLGVRGTIRLTVPLAFFVWGAREMFRSFKGIDLNG